MGQTGIGLCEDGNAHISDNRKFKDVDGDWVYPTHRDLQCPYSAIYSFGYDDGKNIWLYPDAEKRLSYLKDAVCNLIGQRGIAGEHRVMSNSFRNELGKVQDFCAQ